MLGWQPPRSGLVHSPIKRNGVLIYLVMRVPIYLNLTSKAESFVYTICGIVMNNSHAQLGLSSTILRTTKYGRI
jgi:hypothetical protein